MAVPIQYFRIESAVAGNRSINVAQGGIIDTILSVKNDVVKSMNATGGLVQTAKKDIDGSKTGKISVEVDMIPSLRTYIEQIQNQSVTIAYFARDTRAEKKYTGCILEELPDMAQMEGKVTLVFLKING